MKLTVLCGLLLCVFALQAQTKPQKQKVYSVVKVKHTMEWYQEQLALWEEEVKADPKNADAWMNVFTATRMIKFMGGPKTQKDIDAIAEKVNTNFPGTFESNYMAYRKDRFGKDAVKYLMEAYRLGPDREEIFNLLGTHFMLRQEEKEMRQMCERWLASGDIATGILAVNYNMLVSCDQNAILFTYGDNDTFPAWILQYAKNVRTDVTVLNIHMLDDTEFRDMYCKKLGIPEYKLLNEYVDANAFSQDIRAHFMKHAKRPVYYMIGNDFEKSPIKDSLYLVGIVYKYSTERFDNMAVLRKNVEKNYLLDNILVNFENHVSESVVNDFNYNYMVPFLTLYFHYRDAGETALLENMHNYIKVIAERVGLTDEVNNIIKQGKF